jgi:hypothetical protein
MILHHTKNLFIFDADQDQYKFDWLEKLKRRKKTKERKKRRMKRE